MTGTTARGPAGEPDPEPPTGPRAPRALTLAWVDGTYLSTTRALSRHERVALAGLGERVRAAMVVDDSSLRWERHGADEVRVAGPLVRWVWLDRRLGAKLRGQARIVLVSWDAASGTAGECCVTGFLPRSRADSAVLVMAVQRLMTIGAPIDNEPTTLDGSL